MTIKLSRSGIEQFIKCPHCFYLQRKLKLKPPSMFPLTLAIATDTLLKMEFDRVRKTNGTHQIWTENGLELRAFDHPNIDLWRNNFKGVRYSIPDRDCEVFGAVDDLWISPKTNEIFCVDYKSTSKKDDPSIDGGFGDAYKRQMEIYQWLLRKNGLIVSNTGYFLYVNGDKTTEFYDQSLVGNMQFKTSLIEYVGNDDWVEGVIDQALICISGERVPDSNLDCDLCRYFRERGELSFGKRTH